MRRRIIENVPAKEREREIKRGPGGLRDIEFAVQLLQLVHGRGDEALRSTSTLDALRGAGRPVATWAGTTVRRWSQAYRFLRTVEHRLQLQRLRRTHTVPDGRTPDGAAALRWLAQARRLPGRRPPRRGRGVPRRRGSPTPRRYAGCTPSWSTGRWSRRWPGCRARRCG